MINKEFYTRSANYNKVIKQYNEKYYLIEENNLITNEIRNDILMTPEEINIYLNNQNDIIEKVEKAIKSHEKMLQIEKENEAIEKAKEREYNNTYGYTDNMKAMAKGKVLKILNKKENYYDTGKYIGTIARKDFIKNILEAGGTIEHKTNVSNWNKKSEVVIKDNEYRLILQDNGFYIITKTEYDYSMYLLNNIILKAIV